MHTSTFLTIASLATSATAGYTLQEDFMSGSFFDHFDFFNSPDPTHGFVNYVDSSTANAQGYVNTQKGAYIGVDYKNVASSSGRNSVRIQSKSQTTEALTILDLAHMPGGIAGTWPAFWTVGPDWPNNGEIDIIEGVNNQNTNFMTVHSGNQACQVSSTGAAALNAFTSNCWNQFEGNVGCSYHDNNPATYGADFNSQGGGVFAMEHAGNVISVWHFGRNDDLSQVLSDNPNPKAWPAPRAQWLSTSNQFGDCDLSKAVQQQSIVFDTTFCGDWAGAAYPGGNGACNDFVQNNPSAFKEAYWQVNSLKVFVPNGQSAPAQSSSSSLAQPPASSPAQSSPAPTLSTLQNSSPAAVTSTPASASTTAVQSGPSEVSPSPTLSVTAPSSSSEAQPAPTVAPPSTSTLPATPTTTDAVVPPPKASATGGHHHHSKHRQQSTTSTVQAMTTTAASPTTQATAPTDTPEVVIAGSDGYAWEIPEAKEHTKRSIPLRKHGRQFVKIGV